MNDKPNIPKSLKGDIALLHITTYDKWFNNVGSKTRNMIRKAEKCGVTTSIPDREESIVGIHKIYNETPIRQNRAFGHYGMSTKETAKYVLSSQGVFICAYYNNEIVGFTELLRTEHTILISQILSLTSCHDKAVNNALISAIVKYCEANGVCWIIYARFGNHPSLDKFKYNNGFQKYHVKGFSGVKDLVPVKIKKFIIPIYSWFSRRKIKTLNRTDSIY